MNKIKIKGLPFKLSGEIIKESACLVFKAKDQDSQDFFSDQIEGHKIISIFPDINTRVCDLQTHELAKMALEFPSVKFLSITMDEVEVINQWCHAKNILNLQILSDRAYGEFGSKTNLLIPKLKKLARGFIWLDEKNIVRGITINQELSEMPNFELVRKWIAEF